MREVKFTGSIKEVFLSPSWVSQARIYLSCGYNLSSTRKGEEREAETANRGYAEDFQGKAET